MTIRARYTECVLGRAQHKGEGQAGYAIKHKQWKVISTVDPELVVSLIGLEFTRGDGQKQRKYGRSMDGSNEGVEM